MAIDIEKLSLDELLELNKRVVRRIQYLSQEFERAYQRYQLEPASAFCNESGRTNA